MKRVVWEVILVMVVWWGVWCTQVCDCGCCQEEWCTWCGSSGDPAVVPYNCQGYFGSPWVVVVVEVVQWPSSIVYVH